jgi:hypothetical protein
MDKEKKRSLFQFLGQFIMMQTVMITMMNIQTSQVVQRNTAVILQATIHLMAKKGTCYKK